jgi:hypothetical protein
LGRWIALHSLESKNHAQCRNSRNSFLPSPWRRSHAFSRSYTRGSKGDGIWWNKINRSIARRCRCTRWSKR